MNDQLTEKTIGTAIEVHRLLGPGRLDVLVEQEVIVELKSVSRLPEVAKAQTLSYLKATHLKRALLINFGEKRLVDGIIRLSL